MHPTSSTTEIIRPDWLPTSAWPFGIRSVLVDGHALHYTDEGEGPTLLLVHAGMWSFVWRDLIDQLRADHRVVTLDFPGSGLSTSTREPSVKLFRTVLSEFVDALALDDVTLVVHDLGAAVGLGWAATASDRVRALVAINTFGWAPEQPALRRMLRFVGGRPFRSFNVATNLVPRLTATKGGVGRHLDRTARQVFLAPYRVRPEVRHTFHALMRDAVAVADLMEPVEIALAGVLHTRPLLTIFGERNDPFRFQDRWALLMPNGRHEVVEGGNHFPMADAPDDVASWIREWMKETEELRR